MSRHKFVKNIDLDDELGDLEFGHYDADLEDVNYNGDDGDAEGGELTEDDKERMRNCTILVRNDLGPDMAHVSDKDIADSLWYYYYDVDKTVNWLQKEHTKMVKPKKANQDIPGESSSLSDIKRTADVNGLTQSAPVSQCFGSQTPYLDDAVDFFRDCPWLRVPSHRRGQILVEPLYPPGGLAGGLPAEHSKGKVSKLAALAAARKKKEERNSDDGKELGEQAERVSHGALGLLDKLNDERNKRPAKNEASSVDTSNESINSRLHHEPRALRYLSRKERAQAVQLGPEVVEVFEVSDNEAKISTDIDLKASPSAFAAIITGEPSLPAPLGLGSPIGGPVIIPYLAEFNKTEYNAFIGPSPDDIVSNAQRGKGAKKSNKEKATNQITEGVQAITVQDSTKPKSKKLDVLAEYDKEQGKQVASFVVIGHVDHGKSTLLGRLLLDLKVVDPRTVDKYRKEAEKIGKSSFALAWVLDQTSEERNRGVTIDVAVNNFETPKTKFTILDAPGHRDFIPNMIAGASQADFAVLVIDASVNAFESGLKGQTREHALLIRSMGVQRIIVAVNKMDTANWAQERYVEIQQQTLAFLTSSGFQSNNISFVPCSGLNGENIVRTAADGRASWYQGPPLITLLEDSSPAKRALDRPFRMTVMDVFRGSVVHPLSISGRIDAGSLQIGDSILAMPSGEKASIKGIEADDKAVEWAVAGQTVVLHLNEIDTAHLKSGDILCSVELPVTNLSAFTAKVLAFDHMTPMTVDVHRGRLHVSGRISQLMATLDKATGEVTKKKPRVVKPGSVARIKIELDQMVPLEPSTRIILRASGETVAAGLVE